MGLRTLGSGGGARFEDRHLAVAQTELILMVASSMLSPDSARLVPFVYQMLGFEQIKFLAVFVRRCNPKRVVFRALFCELLGRSDSSVDVHEAFVFDRI